MNTSEAAKPPLWTKDYVVLAGINFLTAMNFYLLMVIISAYAMTDFSAPPELAGLCASIFIIGGLVARLYFGRKIQRIGYKRTLILGAGLSLVMTLLYFGAHSVLPLLLVRFLHGAAFGLTTTATATVVALIIPRDRSGEGIGYFALSQTLSTAIGPFIAILLTYRGSFAMIFAFSAMAAAISLAVIPLLSLHDIETNADDADATAEPGARFQWSSLLAVNVIPVASICMLIFVGYSSMVTFLTVYAATMDLAGASEFFFIVYAGAILLSRPAVGKIFDTRGENSIMYPAIIIFTAGLLLLSQVFNGFTLLLAAALLGLGVGAVQSGSQSIAVKITPRPRLGVANSTYFIFCDLGMGLGPLLAGTLIIPIGYRGMYALLSLLGLISLPLYYWLHGRKVMPIVTHYYQD